MKKPALVFESLSRRNRDTRFALLGIPFSFTKQWWLAAPLNLAASLPYGFVMERERTPARVLRRALQHAALTMGSNYAHSLGHILGGKAVGAPMDELIVTATRQVNRYEGDQEGFAPSVHLARAGGGPLANALLALVALLLYRPLGKPTWLLDLLLLNTGIALLAISPVQSGDGEVIWKQIGKNNGLAG